MTNYVYYGSMPQQMPLKAGVKFQGDELVAFTNNGFLVPINHEEAVVFAGTTSSQYTEEMYDNTNGADGGKEITIYNTEPLVLPVDEFAASLDLKLENIRQTIYASANRTFHTSPGKGRLPIGELKYVGKVASWSVPEGADANRKFIWIDTSKVIATYNS